MQDVLSDVSGGLRQGFPLPIRKAMKAIDEKGNGVVVILSKPESADDLINRIRQCHMQDNGRHLPENEPPSDLRTFGVGAQILSDLGVRKMAVIGAPKRMHALAGFGLEVIEYVSVE